MKRKFRAAIVSTTAILMTIGASFSVAQSAPPPMSFVFAGPNAIPDDGGGMSIQFRYQLVLIGIQADRIQVLDAKTGDILVDDQSPKTTAEQFATPSKSTVTGDKWTGKTTPVKITATEPAWLYEKKNTTANLIARAYKDGKVIAEVKQTATFSLAFKTQVFEWMKYNK